MVSTAPPPPSTSAPPPETEREVRPPGLAILFAIVAAGIAGGAGLYSIVEPRAREYADEIRASAPTDPEGRLGLWIEHMAPQTRNFLMQYRVSAEQPWLVTHLRAVEGEPSRPEVWGVPMSLESMGTAFWEQDGTVFRIRVPHARVLGRELLTGEIAYQIPTYGADVDLDPDTELEGLVHRILDAKLGKVLAKEIEGASVEILIDGAEWGLRDASGEGSGPGPAPADS